MGAVTTDVGTSLLIEYFESLERPAAILSTDSGGSAKYLYRNATFPACDANSILDLVDGTTGGIGASSTSRTDASSLAFAAEWIVRRLKDNTVITIESRLTSSGISPSHDDTSCLLLPTSTRPAPFPTLLGQDLTSYPTATLLHNELFLAIPWSETPLGPIHTWSAQLRGIVQTMMASPFPVLVSYGPEYVLLYNEPYSKVIGLKHPSILGMKYGEAWPEVWGVLEPVITTAYQGSMLNVECQEMFLLRGKRLEETYFSYSLIPIRDPNNLTCGLYIPNFDNTVRIVTERRIRSLHEISQRINRSLTQERTIQNALEGMKISNSRDMHFALIYIAEKADSEDTGLTGAEASSSSVGSGSMGMGSSLKMRRSPTSETGGSLGDQGTRVMFRLAGRYGIKDGFEEEDVPLEFACGPGEESSDMAPENTIVRLIRQAREDGTTIHIPDLSAMPSFAKLLNGNPFEDPPSAGIVLPIRSSSEDRLHGVLVLGLNTRLPWDEDYSNYIHLVKGLLATGLATIKLHEEDLSRARYLAALNRQKNEELQTVLKYRTDELKTSELKFTSAFAACPAAIWIGSPKGEIWDMNQAYFDMSGHSRDEPLDDWIKRVHPDDVAYVKQIFDECKTKQVECEFRFLPSDSEITAGVTERWVEATGGPVRDETGTVVMLSGALLDVTIRRAHLMDQTRRADDALELKRLQDHFIDMLSHELRNPLSAICLSSDGVVDSLQLLSKRCEPEVVSEIRDIINDAGVINLCTVHMRRLVDDVLALSKLDNNMLIVTPTLCQPKTFCLEVLEMVKTEMLANDILCEFVVKDGFMDLGVDWVEVDHSRINQILINLITNAIKFTSSSDNRRITLTLDAEASHTGQPTGMTDSEMVNLMFEVVDTGLGMEKAEIERLFQRFAQGSNRTHLTFGGNGLGLFICRRITDLLGGSISAQSHPGQGSTFAFNIPVLPRPAPSLQERRSSIQSLRQALIDIETPPGLQATQPAALPQTSSPKPQEVARETRGTGISLLLVEDNEISQKLLTKKLVRAGCRVTTANDGVEALDYILQSSAALKGGAEIDIVLMDIEMPRKGGIEATMEIRAMEASGILCSRLPVIAVSANARFGQIQSVSFVSLEMMITEPSIDARCGNGCSSQQAFQNARASTSDRDSYGENGSNTEGVDQLIEVMTYSTSSRVGLDGCDESARRFEVSKAHADCQPAVVSAGSCLLRQLVLK